MPLFATLERDSPQHVKLITAAHLAEDFKEKRRLDPQKDLVVMLYGYLTQVAASDTIKEEIERGLMNKSLSALSKTIIEYGVPIDKVYTDITFSGPKGRKIDIFLQQQGESGRDLPNNSPAIGRTGGPNSPKSVKDAELNANSGRQLTLDITAFEVKSSRRTLVPELKLKSVTGISPVEISTGFKAQLTLWKPKLEGLLRRVGQQGMADKIEFAIKITGGGGKSKEFARQISVEIAASLKAALTFSVPIPGTKHDLPIELSYSYGGGYRAQDGAYTDGRFDHEGKGMINVTLFRFKSW
jgi:hypothetical protein